MFRIASLLGCLCVPPQSSACIFSHSVLHFHRNYFWTFWFKAGDPGGITSWQTRRRVFALFIRLSSFGKITNLQVQVVTKLLLGSELNTARAVKSVEDFSRMKTWRGQQPNQIECYFCLSYAEFGNSLLHCQTETHETWKCNIWKMETSKAKFTLRCAMGEEIKQIKRVKVENYLIEHTIIAINDFTLSSLV